MEFVKRKKLSEARYSSFGEKLKSQLQPVKRTNPDLPLEGDIVQLLYQLLPLIFYCLFFYKTAVCSQKQVRLLNRGGYWEERSREATPPNPALVFSSLTQPGVLAPIFSLRSPCTTQGSQSFRTPWTSRLGGCHIHLLEY